MKDDTRKILGMTAGGIAGAKAGAETSKKHPVIGGIGGGFVGGTFGFLFAELVNAVKGISGRVGESKQAEKTYRGVDLDLAEIRGTMRGFIIAGALGVSFFKVYGEELVEWIKEDHERSPTEVYELLRGKRQEWLGAIEEAAQDTYASVKSSTLAYLERSGMHLQELPFDLDPRADVALLKKQLDEKLGTI